MGQSGSRLDRVVEYVIHNGFIWTCLHIIFILLRYSDIRIDQLKRFIEHKYTLPGTYYTAHNYRTWERYVWKKLGEEWTPSATWKESLFRKVIKPYASGVSCILEIGCGAGRWSELLLNMSDHIILVDVSPKAIDQCKSRFSTYSHIEYHVNNGSTLDFIEEETVDFIWSFDVFTIVGPNEIESYIREFSRVLKIGGTGIVQHSGQNGYQYGWSSFDSDIFLTTLSACGLFVVDQIVEWGNGYKLEGIHKSTVMTVFTK